MSGYWGKHMSNNAVEAYERGEMPISKWTKKVLLTEIAKVIESGVQTKVNLETLGKFSLPQLRQLFLVHRGYHHTYATYNVTFFFGIREDRLNCTADVLRKMLETDAGEM